jgi:iron-sulfur cluster repair protein YtfE (RIC family)
MKSTALTETMIRDHGIILKLLTRLEKTIGQEKSLIMTVFHDFFWALEKHFFTEEKAIFTVYQPEENTDGYSMIPELIKEHNEIFNQLKIMEKNIKEDEYFDFKEFKNLLMKHKNFEDEKLYPKLDLELEESEKRRIINRINDIRLLDIK